MLVLGQERTHAYSKNVHLLYIIYKIKKVEEKYRQEGDD